MPVPGFKPPAQAVRLILCENRPEDAEWLLGTLRNAGVPTRPLLCKNLGDIQAQLNRQPVDVLVWGQGFEGVSLGDTATAAAQAGVPLLVALDDLSAAVFEASRLSGADDLYVRGRADLALHVVVGWANRAESIRWATKARVEQEVSAKSSDALLDAVANPVAYLTEGLHVKANAPYLALLGLDSFEDLEGLSLLDFVSKDDAAAVKDKLKRLGRGQGQPEEIQVTLNDAGSITLTLSPAHFESEPALLVSVKQPGQSFDPPPVSAPVAEPPLLAGSAPAGVASQSVPPSMEDWLKKDASTGLFSRQHFLERLRDATSGSAWLVQVDRQEQLVRSLGATQLDAFVKAVGKAWETRLRDEGSFVARWTANTVAIFSTLADTQALEWAQESQAAIARDVLEVGTKTLPVTMSLGGLALVGSMPADRAVAALEGLLKDALALGGALKFHDPQAEEKEKARRQEARATMVQAAISDNRLLLCFQPIASMTEATHRYEVLVRLRSLEGQLEGPSEFMPLAEEHGLAASIDAWVFEHAIARLAEQRAKGHAVELLLKVSPSSLRARNVVQTLLSLQARHGLEAGSVLIEVPMAAAIAQAREAKELSESAKAHGVPLVLSGIGADASSLRIAEMIRPAWLKVAREIGEGLGGSAEKQAELKTVLTNARKLQAKAIGAFVEDAASMTVLFGSGVDAIQGLFLAPPSETMGFDFSQLGF